MQLSHSTEYTGGDFEFDELKTNADFRSQGTVLKFFHHIFDTEFIDHLRHQTGIGGVVLWSQMDLTASRHDPRLRGQSDSWLNPP